MGMLGISKKLHVARNHTSSLRGSTVGRSGTTSSSVSVICGLKIDVLEMPSADLKKETVVASDPTILQTRYVSILHPFPFIVQSQVST